MSALFSKPLTPKAPAPAPPPPTVDDADVKAEQAAAELRKRRGAASTILTGQAGDTGQVTTATKALLGS